MANEEAERGASQLQEVEGGPPMVEHGQEGGVLTADSSLWPQIREALLEDGDIAGSLVGFAKSLGGNPFARLAQQDRANVKR